MEIGGVTFPTKRPTDPRFEIGAAAQESRTGIVNVYNNEPVRPVSDMTERVAYKVADVLSNIDLIWATINGEICISFTVDGIPASVTIYAEDEHV